MSEPRVKFRVCCRLWAAALAGVFLAGGIASAAGPARTRVVFTVDVETKGANRLPDQVDAVCAGGHACGVMEIARILKARGIAGTFFLNVYERPTWGDAPMRDLTVRLQAEGQDVGLHTHPETMFDASRTEMYQYTLDEQTAIVREGVRLLRDWSGAPVVSHRAGDYSADANTLEALRRNDVAVDSSLFFGHPHSGLDALGLPRNLPSRAHGVTEIPVTVFQRADRPRPFGAFAPPVTSVRKIDVDWLIDATEMRAGIDAAVASELPVVVVFLHSFSLMQTPAEGPAAVDRHSVDMLGAIIDHVSSTGLPVVTMRQLAADHAVATSAVPDVVPIVPVRIDWARYTWHAAKAWPVAAAVAGSMLAIAALAVLVMLARRFRPASRTSWPLAAESPSRAETGAGRA